MPDTEALVNQNTKSVSNTLKILAKLGFGRTVGSIQHRFQRTWMHPLNMLYFREHQDFAFNQFHEYTSETDPLAHVKMAEFTYTKNNSRVIISPPASLAEEGETAHFTQIEHIIKLYSTIETRDEITLLIPIALEKNNHWTVLRVTSNSDGNYHFDYYDPSVLEPVLPKQFTYQHDLSTREDIEEITEVHPDNHFTAPQWLKKRVSAKLGIDEANISIKHHKILHQWNDRECCILSHRLIRALACGKKPSSLKSFFKKAILHPNARKEDMKRLARGRKAFTAIKGHEYAKRVIPDPEYFTAKAYKSDPFKTTRLHDVISFLTRHKLSCLLALGILTVGIITLVLLLTVPPIGGAIAAAEAFLSAGLLAGLGGFVLLSLVVGISLIGVLSTPVLNDVTQKIWNHFKSDITPIDNLVEKEDENIAAFIDNAFEDTGGDEDAEGSGIESFDFSDFEEVEEDQTSENESSSELTPG